MKVKFHLKENGEPGRCSAKPGACPITKETGGKHYDSKEEAEKDYEKLNNNRVFSERKQDKKDRANREKFWRLKKSKKMSYALRHHPQNFDFDMKKDGSVDLQQFSQALNIPVEKIYEIAENDDKQRFVIRDNRIWAAQGHSFDAEVKFNKIPAEDSPKFLYHGTKDKFIDSIMKSGLLPQKRKYVHLSPNRETAVKVASRRSGKNVILVIDVEKLMKSGVKLFRSENNVYLTSKVDPNFMRIE